MVILVQVTTDQEAVMAYYYMDENNKVQVTEIYDVTESDKNHHLSQMPNECTKAVHFDDWDNPGWLSQRSMDGESKIVKRKCCLTDLKISDIGR